MQDQALSAGQFAKLARTTKRTVLWYEQKGILKPIAHNQAGYRFYEPRQILDFQVIHLLRSLDFSLEEIAQYLKKDRSLTDLFASKRHEIQRQINSLQKILHDTDAYTHNLNNTGVLIDPQIKLVKQFAVYCIPKQGPYSKIKDYCNELKSLFIFLPKNSTFVTIFEERDYMPHAARMNIGVVYQKSMKLKPRAAIKKMIIPQYKTLSYLHRGPGTLVSLLWQEMERYRKKMGLEYASHLQFADLEFYHKTSLNGYVDEENMEFEINLPIS